MIEPLRDKKGFSLIELMTVLAVTAIVMAGIYTMYFTQTKSHATQQAVVDMQQGIRLAMYLIEKEIRLAGYDPTGSSGATITTAQPGSITFTMDITGGETDFLDNDGDGNTDALDLDQDNDGVDNDGDGLIDEDEEADETGYGDGDTSDALEQITYTLSDDGDNDGIADSLNCSLQRQYWDGAAWLPNPAAEIAFNIDALNFVYLDEFGGQIDDGGGAVTVHISDIRSVQITIVARAGQNPRQGLPNQTVDDKIYRNQQGQVILPAQNDRFRRNILTTEVSCRNLGL